MILVVAEQQRGKLHRASWEAVAFAQELGGDQPVEALVLGANPAAAATELSQAAVAAVHVVDSPMLEPYTPDAYTSALQQAVGALAPTHVVFPHTYRTRRVSIGPSSQTAWVSSPETNGRSSGLSIKGSSSLR
jgi:electron transfer flavoprotein alpha subunit